MSDIIVNAKLIIQLLKLRAFTFDDNVHGDNLCLFHKMNNYITRMI